MNAVERNTRFLLASIQRSNTYREFKRQEEILKQNPEWVEKVNRYRADNFRMHNENDKGALMQEMDHLALESVELRNNPQINAYLDAELALCRLMQKVCRDLIAGVEIDIPEF